MIEPYTMIQAAAILFGAAAVSGLQMAAMRLRGIPYSPAWLVMGHGLLAGTGLILLAYAAITMDIPLITRFALDFFAIAVTAGLIMNLFFHRKSIPLPIPLMVFHALVAATGFTLLLIYLCWNFFV